ncbi:hypothetical protein QCA50_010126 [Cerrena zonata]|uniref:Uncharacterized protein n=1 Tax=Cerrena zonata TaxID=2478898 RepID=A0AAW0G2B6_9APHY
MSDTSSSTSITEDILLKASVIPVYSADGNTVKFGDLYSARETVVTCQDYVRQLAKIRPESLEKAQKDLVVIGCGSFEPIKAYCETAGYSGKIFGEPTRELHRLFGLVESLDRTPAGEQQREYISPKPYLSRVLISIWRGPLKRPQDFGKQGNFSQLGGDFILGPGNRCSFASRMKHTEDHVEINELMREAGVEFP